MGPALLLLLLPAAVLANVGGWAGACSCTHRWPRGPPPGVHLPHLAPRVLRAEPCPHHVRRFVLPHMRLCGLQDSPWVVELLWLWERQAAQRPLAGPPAVDRPTDGPPAADRPTDGPPAADRPTDGPPAADRPTDGPPAAASPTASPPAEDGPLASPLAPLSPPAPEGPPASPPARRSPPPRGPPTSRLDEGQLGGAGGQLPGGPQALPPAPAGWIQQDAVGQDPQTPPPAVGPAPLSVGLVLLGASLGLGLAGVLAWRGGCRGAGRGRGPGPPAPAEALTPLFCPTDVGPGGGPSAEL